MTRRGRRFTAALAAAAAATTMLAVAAPPARAQAGTDEGGPIIIGGPQDRPQYKKFHLEPLSGAIELVNIYQNNKTTTPGGGSFRAQQYLFQQDLELRTVGYVVHPNFVFLNLEGTFGLTETIFDVADDSETAYGTLYTWDASATILRTGDSPLTLYSRRDQSWIFQEFGPAQEAVTTDTGASLEIRSRTLPTRLSVSHLESRQSGIGGGTSTSYTRDAFTWYSSANPSPNQTYTWDYTYNQVQQSGFTDSEYQTHDARLTHEYRFGARNQNTLRSVLDYSNRSGDFDSQRFRWDERLRLRHTDDFRTRYDYTFSYYDTGGIESTQHRLGAGFTHELFDSLTTNGDVAIQRSDSFGAESTEFFASLSFDYRKRVPYGTLTASFGGSYAWQEAEAQTGTTQVLNQPAVFVDPLPIVLTGTNVAPNTILITDPSGLILYQPGVDYTVVAFPDRVEINRIIGGRIAANQAVLLDYVLTPLPSVTSDTQTLFAGARYDIQQGPLRGLGVYARYTVSQQNIDSPVATAFVPNDFTDTIYGVDYRIWQFVLAYEHQIHDSDINPFTADRYSLTYVQPFSATTLLSLSTAYVIIEYEEPANRLELLTMSAQLRHRFSPSLHGSATVLYRDQKDDLFGTTRGFEQQFELTWYHRQLQLYLLLRNAQLDTPTQDDSFQFVQLGLRREF